MSQPAFSTAYDLSFQISPIILVDGIAANTLGGMLPIIALAGQAAGALQGALSGGLGSTDFFARFVPIPGSTLINQTVATYPFANQATAANATIQQPRTASLLMIAPVKDAAGYLTKLAIFSALQSSLQAHNAAGGTYTLALPAGIMTGCLLTSVTDVTGGDTKQQMVQFQWDFIQPLITQSQAASTYSALMSKLVSGAQISGNNLPAGTSIWSNAATAVGSAAQNAVSNVTSMAGVVNQYLSAPI
jgi:hypothetical protein